MHSLMSSASPRYPDHAYKHESLRRRESIISLSSPSTLHCLSHLRTQWLAASRSSFSPTNRTDHKMDHHYQASYLQIFRGWYNLKHWEYRIPMRANTEYVSYLYRHELPQNGKQNPSLCCWETFHNKKSASGSHDISTLKSHHPSQSPPATRTTVTVNTPVQMITSKMKEHTPVCFPISTAASPAITFPELAHETRSSHKRHAAGWQARPSGVH